MPPPDGTWHVSNPSLPQGLTEFQSTAGLFDVTGTTSVDEEGVVSHNEGEIGADDDAGTGADDDTGTGADDSDEGIGADDEAGIADDEAIPPSEGMISSSDRIEITWKKE